MELIFKARNKIAEGQTVTYMVGGKPKKYKKVNGKLVYAGAGDMPAKKKKPTVEKKPVIKKLNKEQESMLKETGILCKDKAAMDYVSGEIKDLLMASGEEADLSKLPRYIRSISFMNSSMLRYTPNKIPLNIDNMLAQEYEYKIDYFKGVPKEIRELVDEYKEKVGPEFIKHRAKVIKLESEYKSHKGKVQSAQNKVADIMIDESRRMLDDLALSNPNKSRSELRELAGLDRVSQYLLIGDSYYTFQLRRKDPELKTTEGILKVMGELGYKKEKIEEIRKIVKEAHSSESYKIIKENSMDHIRNSPTPELVDIKKKEIDLERKKRNAWDTPEEDIIQQEINKVRAEYSKNLWQTTRYSEARNDFSRKMKKLIRKNPAMDPWARGLYVSQVLNTKLLPKQKKEKKKTLLIAADSKGVTTNDQVRKIFAKKRLETLHSTHYKNKLLSAIGELSREGDTKKTFSLASVKDWEMDTIKNKMIKSFDKSVHGSFGVKINHAFMIGDAEYYKKYKKLEDKLKDDGDVIFSYHGTNFASGAKIARGGFKITKPTTGRMIGDGIYGSSKSSKSLQYVGSKFTRSAGTRGVLFVCKNALGKTKVLTNSEVDRNSCNISMRQDGYDTVFAKKGTGMLRNEEWCCKNPDQYLPIYWIDVQLTDPGSKESIV